MVIVMTAAASTADLDAVIRHVEGAGGTAFVSRGVSRTIVGVVGDDDVLETVDVGLLPGVGEVVRITAPYKLVSSGEPRPHNDRLGRRRAGRAGHVHAHRRAVRGRVGRADPGRGAAGPAGRGDAAARRRVQAAHLAVRVPGARR